MAALDAVWQYLQFGTQTTPKARRYHSSVVYKDRIYVFGGQQGSQVFLNDVWILDPVASKWEELKTTNNPTGRSGHSGSLIDGKLYVFGGILNKTTNNELWVLDLETSVWQQITPAVADAAWPSPRQEHSSVVVGADMLIFGGTMKTSSFVNDLWRFSTVTQTWSRYEFGTGDVPQARAGNLFFSGLEEGLFYVFGGFRGDGGFEYLNDTWSLKLDNDGNATWKKLETIGKHPATARPLSSVTVDQRVFVFGGYDGVTKTSSSDLIFFDLKTLSWSPPINLWLSSDNTDMSLHLGSSRGLLPFSRYGHAMTAQVTADGIVFIVVAGAGATYLGDVVKIEL